MCRAIGNAPPTPAVHALLRLRLRLHPPQPRLHPSPSRAARFSSRAPSSRPSARPSSGFVGFVRSSSGFVGFVRSSSGFVRFVIGRIRQEVRPTRVRRRSLRASPPTSLPCGETEGARHLNHRCVATVASTAARPARAESQSAVPGSATVSRTVRILSLDSRGILVVGIGSVTE